MDRYDLVIFEGEVVAGFLEVGYLQEETGKERLADGGIVLGVGHGTRVDFESLLDSNTE